MEKYVITGPGGWIGSALLSHLAERLGPTWRENITCWGSRARSHLHPNGEVEVRDLSTISPTDVDGARVFHLAYLTKEKVELLGELDFLAGNRAIDDYLITALRGSNPAAVFVASSGAAKEAELNDVKPAYSLSKLNQESLFLRYGAAQGIPVMIGRIYNISGPYINKISSYALSSFICQGILRRRINIDSRHFVFRSYLDLEDLLSIVLCEMPEPDRMWAKPVDLCGPLTVELHDVAEAAATSLGLEPDATIVRGAIDQGPISRYLGDRHLPAHLRTPMAFA